MLRGHLIRVIAPGAVALAAVTSADTWQWGRAEPAWSGPLDARMDGIETERCSPSECMDSGLRQTFECMDSGKTAPEVRQCPGNLLAWLKGSAETRLARPAGDQVGQWGAVVRSLFHEAACSAGDSQSKDSQSKVSHLNDSELKDSQPKDPDSIDSQSKDSRSKYPPATRTAGESRQGLDDLTQGPAIDQPPLPLEKLVCHRDGKTEGETPGGAYRLMYPSTAADVAADVAAGHEGRRGLMRGPPKPQAVLLLPGSFNPPTYMHLRTLEMAKDALRSYGWDVLGAYMSPVNDMYGKEGLLSANHRVRMCQLAAEDSSFIMVDQWEASQPQYQRTLVVLKRIQHLLNRAFHEASFLPSSSSTGAEHSVSDDQAALGIADASQEGSSSTSSSTGSEPGRGHQPAVTVADVGPGGTKDQTAANVGGTVRVILVCGADLLRSFTTPGVWLPQQIDEILGNHGVVCIAREGEDVRGLIASSDVLYRHRERILVVENSVRNDVSSTKVREHIRRGLSAKYLLPDAVLEYITKHGLYRA